MVFFLLQSLLAALGSIQFVSNIAFAYFVLNKTVSMKYAIAFYVVQISCLVEDMMCTPTKIS